MSVLFSIVAGWTGRLGPFTLFVDNVPLNLTGFPLPTLVLYNASGNLVTPGGVVIVDASPSTGKVYYDPVVTDFLYDSSIKTSRQTYTVRWKIVDGAGKQVYFPSEEASEIGVRQ